MKAFGALIFVALAAVASAGQPVIPNHPICVPINNDFYHSFADADDCTCFYKCDWANAVRFCCPADNESDGNLVFNPELQVCDRKEIAIAAGAVCSATSDPVTEPQTSPPVTCHPPTEPSPEPTPAPTEASTPEPTEAPTPAPTEASTPEPTEAPTPAPTEASTPEPTEAPTPAPTEAPTDGCAHRVAECPEDNSYYHSYSHAICDNMWCQCDWGKAIEQPCARDHAPNNYLVFDEVNEVCDYQKNGVVYNLCEY